MNTKRAEDIELPQFYPTATTSASAVTRQQVSARSAFFPANRVTASPASSYFSPFSGDHHEDPKPVNAEAAAHFAHSTTLVRREKENTLPFPTSANGNALHVPRLGEIRTVVETQGLSGLCQRTIATARAWFARQPSDYNPLPTTQEKELHSTPSAVFAHYTVEDTLAHFGVSPDQGLPVASISGLLAAHGYNEFSVEAPESMLVKFAKTVYENPLIILLCGSATVSAVMGNVEDAVSIVVAVLIVLAVGFIQEQRSEQSLQALNKLVPHHCHLIRDGQPLHVLANELVPGDMVTFTTGDRVPADIRLVTAVDLEIDESSLTGETHARRKDVVPCKAELDTAPESAFVNGHLDVDTTHAPAALADRTCIAYMGTLVRNGRGSGVVIATGTQTEFGVIFSMMQDIEEKRTPLQMSMDELAKKLSVLSFAVIGVICVIGLLQKRPWLDMFTIGVSLAVAAIPEGLPIVTTVTLALGVLRMSNRKAIVKKLHSVESLGSVSVICSDKTGTLTKNEQTVMEIYAVDELVYSDTSGPIPPPHHISSAVRKTLTVGALCNNAILKEDGAYVGQSTDVALLSVMSVFGMADPRQDFTRRSELSFSSERKYMSVSGTHGPTVSAVNGSALKETNRDVYYIKGSIDAILDRCRFYYVSEDSTPALDANTRNVILAQAQATASRGLRVIAVAYGFGTVEMYDASASTPPTRVSTPAPGNPLKPNLIFVGFQAMLDPPRKGVADAIGLLQNGGVHVVMITGDAEETALSIARALGLRVGARDNSGCLTGQAIDRMSKTQLMERVGGVSVFARATPKHKMAIVEAFQARGAVVAMTGDGVNDAPALKMADIGVSMGKSGTDVAKEAADVILVDDNFSTILPAIEEGKSIFHNIQNFLSFQLSTAVAAIALITTSTFFGLDNPLNAMQILFINILMDGPPSQSLGVDPVDPQVMRRPPRKKNDPIISKQLVYRVLFSATIIVVGTMYIYLFAISDDDMSRREQTMTFTCFVLLDLVSAVQNRGLSCGLFQNRMLVVTISMSFLTQLTLVYVPFMQSIFQTEALSGTDISRLLFIAGLSFGLHEGRRRYERSLNAANTYAAATEEMA